jgi:lipopolysaccharide transport system permease protein
MISPITQLIESRDLLITWTFREFKVRYSQSFLGALWAILQPLSLMLVFSVIFSLFLKVPTDGVPYPVFAYVALLPWTFFSNSISFAVPVLVNNMNLVSKIYFPREVLPFATILVALIDFFIATLVFVALLIIYRTPLTWTIIFVPLLLLIQIIFTFGICLIGAAVNVFYRDIRFIIPLALQILMYLSPIIYPVTSVPEKYRGFYFLNPMAVLIDSYRRVVLFNTLPDWPYLILALVESVILALAGYAYFKHAEKEFADLI